MVLRYHGKFGEYPPGAERALSTDAVETFKPHLKEKGLGDRTLICELRLPTSAFVSQILMDEVDAVQAWKAISITPRSNHCQHVRH